MYFPFSYLSLRPVCDVGGYPVVQGMGYSQLLVFWVVRSIGKITVGVGRFFTNLGGDIVARSRTRTSRKGREDSNSTSFVNWMCLQTEFKC